MVHQVETIADGAQTLGNSVMSSKDKKFTGGFSEKISTLKKAPNSRYGKNSDYV